MKRIRNLFWKQRKKQISKKKSPSNLSARTKKVTSTQIPKQQNSLKNQILFDIAKVNDVENSLSFCYQKKK